MSITSVQRDSLADETTLIETLLTIAPQAAYKRALCYVELRCTLLGQGWTHERFNRTVWNLRSAGMLYLSNSKKSISLISVEAIQGGKSGVCCYCNRKSRQLTRDHILPKSRGGTDAASNIVYACQNCNHIKGDRTPEEWCRDILKYRKPTKPITRLPVRQRLQLAIAATVAIVVSAAKGGA